MADLELQDQAGRGRTLTMAQFEGLRTIIMISPGHADDSLGDIQIELGPDDVKDLAAALLGRQADASC